MTRIVLVSSGGLEQSTTIQDLLTPDAKETARVDAIRWIKQLRLVRYGGVPMRERFRYRSDSLWWFTELYLHKMRRLDTAVDATLALDAAYEAHRPAKIIVDAADPTTAEAARAFGQARKVPIEFRNSTAAVTRHAWSSLLVGLSAKLSRLRPFRTVRIAHRTSRADRCAPCAVGNWRGYPPVSHRVTPLPIHRCPGSHSLPAPREGRDAGAPMW